MKNRLRRILFLMHLSAGVGAGLVIAVMAATGAAMALETQIQDWAERESRTVAVPTDAAARLPLDELLRRVREVRPRPAVTAALIASDPTRAVRVSLGREEAVHVDPYSGAVRPAAGETTRALFAALVRWHRYLGAAGEGRELGRAITGASNAAFLFLALSGLILWWPRRWSGRVVRASLWFRRGLRGRARDWSWHNVIGFWSLPVLLVITFSGLMISYRPITGLIYRLVGEEPPAPNPAGGSAVRVSPPAEGAPPLPVETLVGHAREKVPGWSSMTVRFADRSRAGDGAVPAPAISVKAPAAGPRFASVQLTFDPFSGRLLKDERFVDQSPGRRIRSWLRFLHTGEALGWPGQLLAGVVSIGTLVLVFTGLAMALRRLRARGRVLDGRQASEDALADAAAITVRR